MKIKHICEKKDIKWDKNPVPSDECIEWHGTCKICKRRVLEVYEQGKELYDIDTSEIIQ